MVTIVGHKGAAGYAPENTLPSFMMAISLGCPRAELDVRLTKDQVLVVFHDADVARLTTGQGLVEELEYSDLQQLKISGTEKIPTLQEVIDVCKNKIDLQIELKAKNTPQAVNDIVVANAIETRVVITSFYPELLKEIKIINPQLIVGLLYSTADVGENIATMIAEIPLDFIGPHSSLVTKAIIDLAHSQNKQVYAYDVNNQALGNQLIEFGVDALGTDDPKLFL